MASKILRKISPTMGRILWGEMWASTIATVPRSSSNPLHPSVVGHLKQKVCCSYGKAMYGQKWVWRQQFVAPETANDVKMGIYQLKVDQHFNNLHGTNPVFVRATLQRNINEAKKWVKLLVDTGNLFIRPIKLAAVGLTSVVLIKASVAEVESPGSTMNAIDAMARKRFQSKDTLESRTELSKSEE